MGKCKWPDRPDELSYLREFEHITLARLLLARFQSHREYSFLHEAMGLLERLRQAAEEGARAGSVIEIMIVTALAHQMKGDTPAALGPLERALTLAEPEGYFRIFVDEGKPMEFLLGAASKQGLPPQGIYSQAPVSLCPDRGRNFCQSVCKPFAA